MAEKPTYIELDHQVKKFDKDHIVHERLEEALYESEEKYLNIIEKINVGILIVQDLKLVFANNAISKYLGYTKDELLSNPNPFKFIHSDDIQIVFDRHLKRLRDEKVREVYPFRVITKRGDVIWVEIISSKINWEGSPATLNFFTDINERKKAELALRESEKRYRTLFNSANDAIFIMQGKEIINCNQKAHEMFGSSKEDIVGQNPVNLSPLYQLDGRKSSEKASEKIRSVLDGEPQIFEWQHKRLDGEMFDVEVSLNLIEIKSKKYIQAILRDITKRKRLDKELRLVKYSVEHSAYPFEWIQNDSRFFYVNEATCRALGYTREELSSMCVSDIDPDFSKRYWPHFWKKLKTQKSLTFTSRHRKKNGEIFPVEINANYLKFEGQEHIFAYTKDISNRINAEKDREKLEIQLRQAQKMESIGTLAGGIAHDFNNILSPILIQTEMALLDLPSDSPIRLNLEDVLEAGQRARELVKQILAFSRQSEEERHPVKIRPIIKDALRLLRASLPATIEIYQNLGSESDMLLANITQIHQVLMNLCTNASHAMRAKGGILKVRLDNVVIDKQQTEIRHLSPGSYLRLTVGDTGEGMDQVVLDRIFDPYFTTKDKGEGTGLGLAVVHGIVKSYEGAITVDSERGKGTSFKVYFPLSESRDLANIETRGPIPKGDETILLVDDEKAIIDAVQQALELLGYQVIARTSSIEALEVFRSRPEKFDLVVTDQTMPNMTGKDLTKEVMALRSDIPIILCTGFSEVINEEKAKAIGIREFVMKPIIISELGGIIRKALGKSK